MKKILSFDFNTQHEISSVLAFFAVLILLGCACYWGWKMKGVVVYIGCMVSLIGWFLIYLGIVSDEFK